LLCISRFFREERLARAGSIKETYKLIIKTVFI
jgi:hypothetical protein